MAPRPGGEADKLGNKFEAAWVVRHALYCLLDPNVSLAAEDIDLELAQGSEFTYFNGSATEVHQLKRQPGNRNYWSIAALAGLDIFRNAASHVAAGREYHFVSQIPCGPLKELAERARKSDDLASFTRSWLTSKELRTKFDELSSAKVLGSADAAWSTLRGMWFDVQSESDVIRVNGMLAGQVLEGASGHLAALAIADLVVDNLGKRLSSVELLELLEPLGIRPLVASTRATAREQASAVTDSWMNTIGRELLQPAIVRDEAGALISAMEDSRLGLITGTAGGGKSSVLFQTATALQAADAAVLALRLDRLEPFASTAEIGRQLGLETSPAASLALAADGRDAYLIIDQLDAVSLASGRMPQSFDVVMDLIAEALSVAGVRVILACREFDVENDHRIRELAGRPDMTRVKVGELPVEAVKSAVEGMGFDPDQLTVKQLGILQTPLHLVLLKTLVGEDDALRFQSKGSLFESFWERKRQAAKARRADVRFNEVLARVANAASDRQILSVPIEVLDDEDLIDDGNVLVSERVLVRDGDRIAFFHESFFDYAFARQWVSRGESLVDFLLRDEQELFRRAQVRQILQHLCEREPERFVQELEAVLTSPDVRFHIKEAALAVLANVSRPTAEESALVLRVAATKPTYEPRLWQQLRRTEWFEQFHSEGLIGTWLDGPDDELKNRALDLMVSGSKDHAHAVADLLSARRGSPGYLDWLRWVMRFADVHQSRELFDLLLEAVRDGGYDDANHELWLTVHDLADHQPRWAIELLQARLIDHVNALATNEAGKVVALTTSEHGATELVRKASDAEPQLFAETIVPYLREVMSATAQEQRTDERIRDCHFNLRFPERDHDERDLDDAVLGATARALRQLARSAPDAARPILEILAADPYEASQFLLYRALTAGGSTFADWAAELLLQGEHRLDCGYISDSAWVAREVMQAVAPHVSDDLHQQLEDMVRDLRNPYEQRRSVGYRAFTFLSALREDRLSADGSRRLAEYRRKFERDEPSQPRGIVGGSINSPIDGEAASKMTDDQWLKAMAKYDQDDHDWQTLKGGARELSHLLKNYVVADPQRFALLALRLTPELNTAYGDALLMGFGEAPSQADPEPVFEAIRHIASLAQSDHDRWLGYALRHYYRDAPIDLVELVLDRTLHSIDPEDDTPVFVRSGEDQHRARDLRQNGFNTTRGSLAESLGDLLVYDVDGDRTRLVLPHLPAMAGDPVLSVRSCVAHTVAASLRHARPDAIGAFQLLIDADDILLASDMVQRLMAYIGNVNPEVIDPVTQRMLVSNDDEVRNAGGQLAAFAALEWERPELMAQALSCDAAVRRGVADRCAGRIEHTSNAELATATLTQLFHDPDEEVRKAAGRVAPELRDKDLKPFLTLLESVIDSPTYEHATPQLLITLQHASDRVDDLVLNAARRFIEVYGQDAADIRTSAAGDAHYISDLVVRGLAQSRDSAHRAALLDVLDRLLELGVYGIGDAIAHFERL